MTLLVLVATLRSGHSDYVPRKKVLKNVLLRLALSTASCPADLRDSASQDMEQHQRAMWTRSRRALLNRWRHWRRSLMIIATLDFGLVGLTVTAVICESWSATMKSQRSRRRGDINHRSIYWECTSYKTRQSLARTPSFPSPTPSSPSQRLQISPLSGPTPSLTNFLYACKTFSAP